MPFKSGSGSSLAKIVRSCKIAGGVFILTSDGAGAKKSQTKTRVNHRASNFLGISGIVAPPAPPAFRNVLGRAARIEKQMLPKPKQSWVLVVNGPTLRAGVISAHCQHVVIGTAGLFYNPAVEPILQRSSLEGGEGGRQKAALLYFLVTGGRRIIDGEREGRITRECHLL